MGLFRRIFKVGESLAEAYGEISDASLGVDEEIDKALDAPSTKEQADSLAELKKKMGISK
jgi:hypothetical protein